LLSQIHLLHQQMKIPGLLWSGATFVIASGFEPEKNADKSKIKKCYFILNFVGFFVPFTNQNKVRQNKIAQFSHNNELWRL